MKIRLVAFTLIALLSSFCAPPFGWTQEAKNPNGNGAGKNGIQLNFRGASLDTVLDYLSQSAGFVIIKQTQVSGTIDVWSHQPVTPDEAIDLLNTVLHEKGFAAIRNNRTLTIVSRDEAKQKDIPVKKGNNPEEIPKNDEMVTQIVPLRNTDAEQLVENLQQLLPSYATLSANESSNALIITDTQSHVRRMVEIISALDSSISDISTIKVFPMQYSDATELAQIITTLFQEDTSTNRRGGASFGRFPMPFGGDRGDRGDRGNQDSSDSEAKRAASRVVAVADENSNSLIVIAPEELMPMIEMVVKEVDTTMTDITEIRVFQLQYADSTELAEQIQELFPDESSQNQTASRFGPGGFFGGPPMPGGGGRSSRGNQEQSSERKLQQTTVRSVADPRTNSILISAAHDTMIQIAQMIERLDKDPARKQKVYVYQLEYADVDNVAEILRNIFENQYNSVNRNTSSTQNANTLGNRTVNDNSSQAQQSRFNQ